MDIVLKRIENAIKSEDITLMKVVLEDTYEIIKQHTFNYDLPREWQINDLFRLTEKQFNENVLKNLSETTDELTNLNIKMNEFLDWLRVNIKSYQDDTYGMAKTFMLLSATLTALREGK